MPGLGFRLLALLTAFSAWALVVVGGVVRVSESGLGCPDWPLCHGGVVPAGRRAPLVEYSHRATATVMTLLVLATAAWALGACRGRRDVVVPALAAAALVPFQALLGATVVWLELPGWLVAVHFVVGMLFLAAAVVTAERAWHRPVVAWQSFVRLAWAGAAAGLVLVALGAAVVATNADEACGTRWPGCSGSGGVATLQSAHRSGAYVLAGTALALAILAWRGGAPRVAGAIPVAAVVGQIAIGVSLGLAPEETTSRHALEVLHVAGAGAVWASLVAVASLVGPPSRRREQVPGLVSFFDAR